MPHVLFSEEEIVLRLRSGDARQEAEAIRYVQRQYRGLVIQLVRKLGGDLAQDVPDVLNDATAATVRQVQNGVFQLNRAKLSTYFRAIAENILRNILRERRNRREVSMPEIPALKPAFTLSEAEKSMNSEEARKKVAAAIRKLDKPCRQVLEQYWLKEQSLREIGEDMGKTEDAVKKLHQRCKERLRALLGNDLKDLFND